MKMFKNLLFAILGVLFLLPISVSANSATSVTLETYHFTNGDYLFFPQIRKAVEEKDDVIRGYVVGTEGLKEFDVALGELTDDEREIILKGCLINYNRK